MKVGERWSRDDGSVWTIIRLTRTTPERESREEGVDIMCVKQDDSLSDDSPEEKLLMEIFGNRFNVGDYDSYTRTAFLHIFTKVY